MMIYRKNRDGAWILIDEFDQAWALTPSGDRDRPLEITPLERGPELGFFATLHERPITPPPGRLEVPLADPTHADPPLTRPVRELLRAAARFGKKQP